MPRSQDSSGAQETVIAASWPCKPKRNQSLGRWDPDFPVSRRWMLGGAAGRQLFKWAPHMGTKTCPKASHPTGSCWVPNTSENLVLGVGTEPWQIRLPALLKICHHVVNVKRQVFQMGKVRLSPSANSRTTQGIIAQMSNKNSRLSKHHTWTFFDPQIWML